MKPGQAPEGEPMRPRYVVGVTGASGAIYARRFVRRLLAADCRVDLIVSPAGRQVLSQELGYEADWECSRRWPAAGVPPEVAEFWGVDAGRGELRVYPFDDVGADVASGSVPTRGMVVIPCSMGTASGIATGRSSNLIERAADVMLKERRPLILVVREAPLSLIHLRNLVQVTEAGAIVLPASPGFYHRPTTVEALVDFVVGKVLNVLGLAQDALRPWDPEAGPSGPSPA